METIKGNIIFKLNNKKQNLRVTIVGWLIGCRSLFWSICRYVLIFFPSSLQWLVTWLSSKRHSKQHLSHPCYTYAVDNSTSLNFSTRLCTRWTNPEFHWILQRVQKVTSLEISFTFIPCINICLWTPLKTLVAKRKKECVQWKHSFTITSYGHLPEFSCYDCFMLCFCNLIRHVWIIFSWEVLLN